MQPDRYNIRVYGICIDAQGRVLLTDERRNGVVMTKFPGGGHDLGEGIGDALRREFLEEANTAVELGELYYLNDFLQISAFNQRDQLISIYYMVSLAEPLGVDTVDAALAFGEGNADVQTFRWVPIDELDADDFRFPIDKVVVERLKAGQR